MNRASLGCLLNFIGGWLQVGALGIMAFVIFLSWCGVHEGLRIFTVIAGLLGLAYLLASATGIGFLISGPRNRGALGLSIATAGVAGLHLMTVIVLATSRSIGEFAAPNTARSTEVAWSVFVSQLQALPGLLFWEIGWDLPRGRVSDGGFLPVFLYFVEIARMVLFLLTLRAIMLCAKDAKGASTCMKAMIAYASGAGGLIIVGILFGLLLLGMKPTGRGQANLDSVSAIFHLCYLVLFLVPAALAVGTALIVKSVKGRIDYRR